MLFSRSGTRSVRFGLDCFGCGAQRFVGFAAFFGAAHVGGGVGEGDARFGEADEFAGLLGGDGDGERFGVGRADLFAGEDAGTAKVNCWLNALP